MKLKRHRSQQVIRKLGDAETALACGKPLAAVCQMYGISEQTYYRWKNQFDNMKADETQQHQFNRWIDHTSRWEHVLPRVHLEFQ